MPDYVLEALEKVILSFIFHFFKHYVNRFRKLVAHIGIYFKMIFYSSMSGYEEFLKYFFYNALHF